jgi:uncharacterized protein YkwD
MIKQTVLLLALTIGGGWACPALSATTFELRVIEEVNKYRARNGRSPLVLDQRAHSLAAQHTRRMAAANKLSHDGFSSRRRQSGFRACAENVGFGRRTPEALVASWKQSSAHNANLLKRQLKVAGVSQEGSFVTFLACG